MDLQTLSPRLRRFLENRLDNPRFADEAPFIQEDELSELLGVFPQSEDFTCLGQASSSGAQCRSKISLEQRYIAQTLLRGANQTFPDLCANINELIENFEQIASYLLCQRNHQKQISDLARVWLLKTVQYRVLECDMRYTRFEGMLDSLVVRFNNIGEQLRVDGHLSPEAFDAGRIQVDELNPGAYYDDVEQVAVVDVNVDEDEAEDADADADVDADVDDEFAPADALQASTPHLPAAQPHVHHFIYHAGSVLNLQRSEARNEKEEENADEPTRMTIEGDCPICQEPLINAKVEASLLLSSSSSSSSSSSHPLYESHELSYCSRLCGRNFHMDCINRWINTCNSSGWSLTCPNWYGYFILSPDP
ncbi:hypothetical protein EMCG_04395 [[Emmonsia] crescens]|uniref:RING-type domain-containing protein n=1 Tax=[Emmonsia] crescens TaxID=73230 RepID=A0A0G2HS88_9EURO|nr:hypothetical protein EMCG_04395 [Emmonsia crescens UAMH 3008]